ncbi:MAG: hypothetical protein R2695_22060 [Acidimicrobiales bacterium]
MKLDAGLIGDLRDVGDRAAALEAFGYDGLLSAELSHDPFFRSCSRSYRARSS